jgi:hypothetical protein
MRDTLNRSQFKIKVDGWEVIVDTAELFLNILGEILGFSEWAAGQRFDRNWSSRGGNYHGEKNRGE